MPKLLGRSWLVACLLLVIIGCSFAFSRAASAAAFGQNSYGSCAYGVDCSTATSPPASGGKDMPATGVDSSAPQTTVQLTSGLDVAVNLHDGQNIPLNGYAVVVTPLNGHGSSFKSATFYADGTVLATAAPADTGTVTWFWKPGRQGTVRFEVRITDQSSATVVKVFMVTVGVHAAAAGSASASSDVAVSSGASGVIQHFFRILPPVITRTFPYVLFALLGLVMVLLGLQTFREMRERRTLLKYVSDARELSDARSTFNALISHYLRTPLTLLNGGLDMLAGEVASSESAGISQAKALLAQMTQQATGLITEAANREVGQNQNGIQSDAPRLSWRYAVGLWLPIVAIGLAGVLFDYLAIHIGKIEVASVDLLTQAILFVVLAVLFYQVCRRWQLQHRDARHSSTLLNDTLRMHQAKEQFIADSVARLLRAFQAFDAATANVQPTQNGAFIIEGKRRLKQVLSKLTIAATLRSGARPDMRPEVVRVQAFVNGAKQLAGSSLDGKDVAIAADVEEFAVAEPKLLQIVLGNVLDNAAAYSQSGSKIEVSITRSPDAIQIRIQDQGEGIPREKLRQLFQPFTKGEHAERFNHEGMGFSLYLDKLIMTYMGGAIALKSAPGHGTTVTMALPAKQPATAGLFLRQQPVQAGSSQVVTVAEVEASS